MTDQGVKATRETIDKAPKSISQWAYGVLALYTVAAAGLSYFSQSIISLIIASSVSIFFFFAVWGFAQIATNAKSLAWRRLGYGMVVIVFGMILFLVGSIFLYIVTGQPETLDLVFPRAPVSPPSGVSVKPT